MNAHTGELDDRSLIGDAVLDDLGAAGDQPAAVPARRNSDTSPVNQSGHLWVGLCTATKCFLLNGRAPGDETGRATFGSYSLRRGWGGGGVLDHAVFCVAKCLNVSVDKSAVVVFGRRKLRPGSHIPRDGWVLAGAQIPVVSELSYLGIVFRQTAGVSACTSALSAAAMWCMLSRCKYMQMPTLQLQVSLFESLVSPILSYCSEVWGPSVLSSCSSPA
jgi:hypothetical protein